MKYKKGDILTRNDKSLDPYLSIDGDDLQKIKIVSHSYVANGDTCNGYKVRDFFTDIMDRSDYSEGYLDFYYDDILITRKEKLQKINNMNE